VSYGHHAYGASSHFILRISRPEAAASQALPYLVLGSLVSYRRGYLDSDVGPGRTDPLLAHLEEAGSEQAT